MSLLASAAPVPEAVVAREPVAGELDARICMHACPWMMVSTRCTSPAALLYLFFFPLRLSDQWSTSFPPPSPLRLACAAVIADVLSYPSPKILIPRYPCCDFAGSHLLPLRLFNHRSPWLYFYQDRPPLYQIYMTLVEYEFYRLWNLCVCWSKYHLSSWSAAIGIYSRLGGCWLLLDEALDRINDYRLGAMLCYL